MDEIYLQEHKSFRTILNAIEEETDISGLLIEKDYWIMHCLYAMKQQGLNFQMKGGTSLSKGFGLISRFSEDIDIHIDPPIELGINENPNNHNPNNIEKKRLYYDTLAEGIKIAGINEVLRDHNYDDIGHYNSGGIRLNYDSQSIGRSNAGIKEGILLEVGFDNVAPNIPVTISSWMYDRVKGLPGLGIIDNRAVDILCYDPCYTFVEKLQTIVTKFRRESDTGRVANNYMRQYYDIYCLLTHEPVLKFIGSGAYFEHKKKRFPKVDFERPLAENEAFLLSDEQMRVRLMKRYEDSKMLYYHGQPSFEEILGRIQPFLSRL